MLGLFGGRQFLGGRAWGFCGGVGRDKGVNTLEGQSILGEVVAGRTGFRIIKISVPEGTANGVESNNIIGGGFHHIFGLPVLRYHRIRLNYPYPFWGYFLG